MEVNEDNLTGFLSSMEQKPSDEIRALPFLGIDECFNRKEIDDLSISLIRGGLIECSSPLWYELRGSDSEITGSFCGGVSRNSPLREPNPLISNLGSPLKGQSWSDYQIAQMLIVNFISYQNIVFLTENIRKDRRGIRNILNKFIGPALNERSDSLSLTAIYKKGKTGIIEYCSEVTNIISNGDYLPGYQEVMV